MVAELGKIKVPLFIRVGDGEELNIGHVEIGVTGQKVVDEHGKTHIIVEVDPGDDPHDTGRTVADVLKGRFPKVGS